MITYGRAKSRYKHMYTSRYNSPNSPRAEQPAIAVVIDFFGREFVHEEPNTAILKIKYFYYTKNATLCRLENQVPGRKKYDCCRGWVV